MFATYTPPPRKAESCRRSRWSARCSTSSPTSPVALPLIMAVGLFSPPPLATADWPLPSPSNQIWRRCSHQRSCSRVALWPSARPQPSPARCAPALHTQMRYVPLPLTTGEDPAASPDASDSAIMACFRPHPPDEKQGPPEWAETIFGSAWWYRWSSFSYCGAGAMILLRPEPMYRHAEPCCAGWQESPSQPQPQPHSQPARDSRYTIASQPPTSAAAAMCVTASCAAAA